MDELEVHKAMTLREQVLQQVLALPLSDQALIAQAVENHLLSQSLPKPGIESEEQELSGELLLSELRRRSAAYRAGATTARDVAAAMTDLRTRQSRESQK